MLWNIISFPFWVLNHIIRFIFPDGSSWSLRPHERKLIAIAARGLTDGNRRILDTQLSTLHFVERMHSGRIVGIHFEYWRNRVKPMDVPPECNLAKLKIKSKGGTVDVSIGCHAGLISSITFKKPPAIVLAHDFEVIRAEYGGMFDDSVYVEIDEDEHDDVA